MMRQKKAFYTFDPPGETVSVPRGRSCCACDAACSPHTSSRIPSGTSSCMGLSGKGDKLHALVQGLAAGLNEQPEDRSGMRRRTRSNWPAQRGRLTPQPPAGVPHVAHPGRHL